MLTRDEVEYLARDSGAVAMVTDTATWRAMRSALEGAPALRHVLVVGDPSDAGGGRIVVHDFERRVAGVDPAPPHPTRADDPAYLVYTSGTTGYPKGVLHAHRALLGRQPSSEYWFDFDPAGERVLHAGKYNWTYVLGTGLMDPLHRGHTAIVCEGATDAAAWVRRIAGHRATIFIAVPTVYRQIRQKTAATGADVPALRHCMSAGEQLPAEVLDGARALRPRDLRGARHDRVLLLSLRDAKPSDPAGLAGFAAGTRDHAPRPATWREVPVDVEAA
jgi:acyl-coenzyme A synthetase/AMP-(fatty) acid ligase